MHSARGAESGSSGIWKRSRISHIISGQIERLAKCCYPSIPQGAMVRQRQRPHPASPWTADAVTTCAPMKGQEWSIRDVSLGARAELKLIAWSELARKIHMTTVGSGYGVV